MSIGSVGTTSGNLPAALEISEMDCQPPKHSTRRARPSTTTAVLFEEFTSAHKPLRRVRRPVMTRSLHYHPFARRYAGWLGKLRCG